MSTNQDKSKKVKNPRKNLEEALRQNLLRRKQKEKEEDNYRKVSKAD